MSWEERFLLGLANHIDTKKLAKVIFLNPKENQKFSDVNLSSAQRLLNAASIKFQILDISYYDHLEVWRNLDTVITNLPDNNILFDISTMPRHIILTCLHNFEKSKKHIDTCYFPPSSYGEWLSRDQSKPQFLYRHSGIMYPDLPTCLLVLAGFEFERISSLINFTDSAKVIVVIQTGLQFDNSNKQKYLIDNIEKRHSSNITYFYSDFYSDPLDQAEKLNEIISDFEDEYNIMATTFAPKNSTIALYLLNRINSKVGLSYSLCREYNFEYSSGIDVDKICSHVVDFSLTEEIVMKELDIAFRGPRISIDELLSKIMEIKDIESARVVSIDPVKRQILDRQSLKQVEVVDFVIAFILNVASAAVYDKIKSIIAKNAKEMGCEDKTQEVDDNKKE
ncbi:hypothetical protein FK216_06145 [Moraxellaceae bacterium AER2_44_116]|nr:hypothetical protein [Moraxellaceae bacterium]TQC98436.1 hypothetical protein FK216_06145 [Moraxellaceae bacterium AER2_44_116]